MSLVASAALSFSPAQATEPLSLELFRTELRAELETFAETLGTSLGSRLAEFHIATLRELRGHLQPLVASASKEATFTNFCDRSFPHNLPSTAECAVLRTKPKLSLDLDLFRNSSPTSAHLGVGFHRAVASPYHTPVLMPSAKPLMPITDDDPRFVDTAIAAEHARIPSASPSTAPCSRMGEVSAGASSASKCSVAMPVVAGGASPRAPAFPTFGGTAAVVPSNAVESAATDQPPGPLAPEFVVPSKDVPIAQESTPAVAGAAPTYPNSATPPPTAPTPKEAVGDATVSETERLISIASKLAGGVSPRIAVSAVPPLPNVDGQDEEFDDVKAERDGDRDGDQNVDQVGDQHPDNGGDQDGYGEHGPMHRNLSKRLSFGQMRKSLTGDAALWWTSLTTEDDEPPPATDCVGRMVQSKWFEGFFNTVISINSVSMGVEADNLVNSHGPIVSETLEVMEHLFTALFTFELVCRWWTYGYRRFLPTKLENSWNVMDFCLVVFAGIGIGWILPLCARFLNWDSEGGFLRTVMVFRSIRLLRVVRVIQKEPFFKEVWLLLQGLTGSIRILFWTCVVIFTITYMFSIFGVWVISNEVQRIYKAKLEEGVPQDELDALREIMSYIGGLDLFIRTLIQFLTLDSWNSKMELILKYVSYAWVFFYLYISVAVFVLMNLVTAIIVDNALCHSRQDEEARMEQQEAMRHKELEDMKGFFHLMDNNGDGGLDWDEFEAAFNDPMLSKKWKVLDFHPEECKDLFDLLDDGDGNIETDEFFAGLKKVKGLAQSRDIVRLSKNVDRVCNAVGSLGKFLGFDEDRKSRSDAMSPSVGGMKDTSWRLNSPWSRSPRNSSKSPRGPSPSSRSGSKNSRTGPEHREITIDHIDDGNG